MINLHISTKGRYGLEAIVDLAFHYAGEPISLKSIAERCSLSEEYILQIFLILRRAGIVKSIRGTRGGYVLTRNQSDITVGDVLTALEGPLAPTKCVLKENEDSCERYGHCVTHELWKKIMIGINEVINSITIEDLVKCYKNYLTESEDLDYYI